MRTRAPSMLFLLLLLVGCSGGGGGGQDGSQPQQTNSAPRASDLSIRTNESEAVSERMRATDADGDSLTFSIATQPQKGSVAVDDARTGDFTYTPTAGEHGVDTFTFTVSDGEDASNVGNVNIEINRLPVATEITKTISSVNLTPWDGMLAGSDPDGDSLEYVFVSSPSKGSLTSTDTSTGAFSYEPRAGQSGTDEFRYQVSDGFAISNEERVIITFNDPPTATDDSLDVLQNVVANGVLGAIDPENDALVFSIAALPTRGTVEITDSILGEYLYTPTPGESGADSFTFVVADAHSESNAATVSIAIYERPIVGFVENMSYAYESKVETVLLTLSHPIPFDVRVQLETAGNATNVDDYEILTSAPVTIPAESIEEPVEISIIPDDIREDETLELSISSAVNADVDGGAAVHQMLLDDWRGTTIISGMSLPLQGGGHPDLVIDGAGSLFIAGNYWFGGEKRFDALAQKRDYRGEEQWTTTFAGGANDTDEEYATGIGLDSLGNVYFAGTRSYPGAIQGFVIKMDSFGNVIWERGIVGNAVEVKSMKVDANDNIIVVGRGRGTVNGEYASSTDTDAVVVKFDPNGNEMWTRLIGGSDFEIAHDVAVGSLDQIYVGIRGHEVNGVASPTAFGRLFVVRLAADGTPEWTQMFGSPSNDMLNGMAVDAADNVYVTGYTEGLIDRPGNVNRGGNDIYIAKYDRDGIEQWILMDGSENWESGLRIAVTVLGDLMVTGNGWGGGQFVAKYDADGNQLWKNSHTVVGTNQQTGGDLRSAGAWAIVEDSAGDFFMLGEDWPAILMKMDSSGQILD